MTEGEAMDGQGTEQELPPLQKPGSEEKVQPLKGGEFTQSWVMGSKDEYADPFVARVARQLHRNPPEMNTPDYLGRIFGVVQDRVILGEVEEAKAEPLLSKIEAKIKDMTGGEKKSPLESGLEALTGKLSDLVTLLEQKGQLRPALTPSQIERMTSGDVLGASQLRAEQLREAFGRVPSEEEKDRWIDVEVEQEFYTRFSPNMEPYFYTKSSRKEREVWDARWRLARAAFVKNVFGGRAEKLTENQDLVELKKEQMEVLYNVEGVKEALSWYVGKIVKGEQVDVKGGKMTFFECSDGNKFRAIRHTLRLYLFKRVFKDEPRGSRDEKRALLMKIKSADAIAWNWVFCSNLVESVDSRYSRVQIGNEVYKGVGRHGGLAPAICSDDLRAVFHPQEKFEDKCSSGLEWGAFGKWGVTQTERVKKESGFDKEKDIFIFEGASSTNRYWTWERTDETKKDDGKEKRVIRVFAPECYPTTSVRSFFEEYNKLTTQILNEGIDWSKMKADLWKTSYLTVRLPKAVGLFEYFTKEAKEGWARALTDIYARLSLKERFYDYYCQDLLLSLREPNEQQKIEARNKARRMADTHFHNLKVWAVYATQGGIGRPQDRKVTDPYSESVFEIAHRTARGDHEAHLRKPQAGYLNRGLFGLFSNEDLIIKSIE